MDEQRESDFEIQKLKQENIDNQKEMNLMKTQTISMSNLINNTCSNSGDEIDHTQCLLDYEKLKLENYEQIQATQKQMEEMQTRFDSENQNLTEELIQLKKDVQ